MNLSERARYDQSVSLLDTRLYQEREWRHGPGTFSLTDSRPGSAPNSRGLRTSSLLEQLPTSTPSFQAQI